MAEARDQSLVRNEMLRTLHGVLLLSFPRESVGQFWSELPLHEPGNLPKTIEGIWKKGGLVPVEYLLSVYSHLEKWLKSKEVIAQDFSTEARRRLAEIPVLSARDILLCIKPFIPYFHTSQDLRQLILKLLDNLRLPGSTSRMVHRLVYQNVRYGWRRDVVLFAWDIARRSSFDYATWMLPHLLDAPRLLDLPSYEQHKLLCDSRLPSELLENMDWQELPSGELLVDGKVVGKASSFSGLWRAYGMELDTMNLPDTQGILMESDVVNPHTGKIMMQGGCMYGAPVHMVELRYPTSLGRRQNPLQKLVEGLIEPEFSVWSQITERHELLLQELQSVLEITYYKEEDSIALGNEHLMRSVPAKILRNILREFVVTGRAQFQNREFKRDPEICMDSLNPNFEGRLNRLIERLRERSNGVLTVERKGRGEFCFYASKPLRFREM